MKVKFVASINVSSKMHEWSFLLIPTIGFRRYDVFADESCYRIAFQWLVFYIGAQITTPKKIRNYERI